MNNIPAGLEWYRNRANNGRGRVSAEDSKLIKLGLLKFSRTSMYSWVITLTENGKAILETVVSETIN